MSPQQIQHPHAPCQASFHPLPLGLKCAACMLCKRFQQKQHGVLRITGRNSLRFFSALTVTTPTSVSRPHAVKSARWSEINEEMMTQYSYTILQMERWCGFPVHCDSVYVNVPLFDATGCCWIGLYFELVGLRLVAWSYEGCSEGGHRKVRDLEVSKNSCFFHINKAKIILQDVARACKQNGGSVEEERGYVWELGSQNPIDGSSSSQFKEKHVDPPSFLDNLSHVVGYMMKYTVIYRYIHLYSSYSSHTPIVSPVISLVGCVISNWWGIFSHGDLVVTLVWPEVDVDQSGSLDLREFILCMRKVREVELKAVKFLGSQMMDITGLFNEISPWNKGWTWFNHRHYGNRMEFLVVTCCNWELVRYPQIPSSKTVCHGKWAHGNKGQSSTTISFSMAMLNYQRVIDLKDHVR